MEEVGLDEKNIFGRFYKKVGEYFFLLQKYFIKSGLWPVL